MSSANPNTLAGNVLCAVHEREKGVTKCVTKLFKARTDDWCVLHTYKC